MGSRRTFCFYFYTSWYGLHIFLKGFSTFRQLVLICLCPVFFLIFKKKPYIRIRFFFFKYKPTEVCFNVLNIYRRETLVVIPGQYGGCASIARGGRFAHFTLGTARVRDILVLEWGIRIFVGIIHAWHYKGGGNISVRVRNKD